MQKNRYFETDHLKKDIKRRTVRGGAITAIAQVAKQALSVFSTIILARLLTPQDYGLIAMVTVVTGFIGLFRTLGLSLVTVQRPEINHEQVSTLFWLNIAFCTFICLLSISISPLVSWYYNEPRLILITITLSVGFIFGGFTIQHQALLKRQMLFNSLAFMELVAIAAGLIGGITAAYIGLGYWALVISILVTQATSALLAWIVCKWRPGKPGSLANIKDMLKLGGNLTGFDFINYFSRNLDNFLIGRFFGSQQLGLYNRAYSLLLMPLRQINAPISSVAIPALSRLFSEPDRYRLAYLRILEKLVLVTMPGIVFLILTSDWLFLALLGPQWVDAARIFSFLGIAGLVQPVLHTTGWLFLTQDRTHHQLRWGFISSGISMAAIAGGLPWGPVGVAVSYAFSEALLKTPILFWYVGRTGPVRTADFYRSFIPAFISSVCITLALLLYRNSPLFNSPLANLSITLAISAAVGLLGLLAFKSGRNALKDLLSIVPLFITPIRRTAD